MRKLATAAFLSALSMAPVASAREAMCGSGESKVGEAVLSVSFSTASPGQPVRPWANIWFGDKDAPLRMSAGFKTAEGAKLGPVTSLSGGYEELDLHAPIRSSSETLVATTPDGQSWRSRLSGIPYPHAPYPGDRPSTSSDWLANRMEGFPRLNEDLFAYFDAGRTLTVKREGDGGETFSAVEITPPTVAVRERMYAEAMAQAQAKLRPCGPPVMISQFTGEVFKPPRLYLRPRDVGAILTAPTLAELGKIDPRLASGRILGRARVACVVDPEGRLRECAAKPGADPEWLGQVSQVPARQVVLAERLADGRRTFGLGVVLSLTWEKTAIRYEIAPSDGMAIPAS
jgi:hypothetical protein